MAKKIDIRSDLNLVQGYHSPQVEAKVRLNANESPFGPPSEWIDELIAQVSEIGFNRYPDRSAWQLRSAIADIHSTVPERVFCAKGSNEVIQCLLLAYGGPGRKAVTFEPTYLLHSHISRITGTEVSSVPRGSDFLIPMEAAYQALERQSPEITFLCSPNNPTGIAEPRESVLGIVESAPGIVVIDEAYGQFASWSALELVTGSDPPEGVAVVRTFSKTWSMAACRLGYMVGDAELVSACEAVALPYHLDSISQLAGVLALQYVKEMEGRMRSVVAERKRVAMALESLGINALPSESNFILFNNPRIDADTLWKRLLDKSVLVRNCASWPGLAGFLRVTIGLPEENDAFLVALGESLG
ncbi:MAG TPA: histidinol-phosphate transaminase [Acidimicrobiales bacterium]|nr:histidinol-phosphate transaminase [Acidimicrobiales bacterium]